MGRSKTSKLGVVAYQACPWLFRVSLQLHIDIYYIGRHRHVTVYRMCCYACTLPSYAIFAR